VVEKLPRILMMNNSDLIHMTLKLLLNLSFTLLLRERMVRVGFLPKLVSLLSEYIVLMHYSSGYNFCSFLTLNHGDCMSMF
jgi:hypothetical protein